MGLVELTSLTEVDEIKVQHRLDARVRDQLFDVVLLARNLSSTVWFDDVANRIFLQSKSEVNSRAIRLEEYHLNGVLAILEFAASLKDVNNGAKNGNIKFDVSTLATAGSAPLHQGATAKAREKFDYDNWQFRARTIGNNLSLAKNYLGDVLRYRRKMSPKNSPFVKANFCPEVPCHFAENDHHTFEFALDDVFEVTALCRLIENDEKIYARWTEKGKPKTSQEVVYAEDTV